MNNTLQNEITANQVAGYIKSPSSSLLIEGSHYESVQNTADNLISSLLGTKNKSRLLTIGDDLSSTSIGVQDIREVKTTIKTKMTPAEGVISRVIRINQAEKMTSEAQNALLKILEEPTAHTVLILATTDRSKLLATIRSRCQVIRVLPITEKQAIAYGEKEGIDRKEISSAYLITSGDPALFQAMVRSDDTSTFKQHIDKAKRYLQLDVFNRLTAAEEFGKTAAELRVLLRSLERISEAALHRSSAKDKDRWIQIAEEVRACQTLLDLNVLVKLVYLRLSQSI